MRQHANRLTVLTLAAVSVVFVGCDGPQTQRNKEIQENLKQAQKALLPKGPETQPTTQAAAQSLAFLEKAAAVKGASRATAIDAQMFLAQDYYNKAIALLGKLDDLESAATLALRQIQSGVKGIERNNVQVKILLASEPAEARLFPDWAMLDDPARSWLWNEAQVAAGAVTHASTSEVRAVFERIAREHA